MDLSCPTRRDTQAGNVFPSSALKKEIPKGGYSVVYLSAQKRLTCELRAGTLSIRRQPHRDAYHFGGL